MILRDDGIWQFQQLAAEPGLVHGVLSPRVNVSFSVGEGHGDPVGGRRALFTSLGIDSARVLIAGQVHGTRVARVTAADAGAGALVRGTAIPDTDGLFTNETGTGLLITGADCPPLLLYSAAPRLLALAHCGWRGTAAGIVSMAVDAMTAAGARLEEIRAGVGPGIGVCCYEVGDDVVDRIPAELRGEILQKNRGPRPFLHLKEWIARQLLQKGVRPENMEVTDLCTSCRTDVFFSHRAEKGHCGRFGLAAALAG